MTVVGKCPGPVGGRRSEDRAASLVQAERRGSDRRRVCASTESPPVQRLLWELSNAQDLEVDRRPINAGRPSVVSPTSDELCTVAFVANKRLLGSEHVSVGQSGPLQYPVVAALHGVADRGACSIPVTPAVAVAHPRQGILRLEFPPLVRDMVEIVRITARRPGRKLLPADRRPIGGQPDPPPTGARTQVCDVTSGIP